MKLIGKTVDEGKTIVEKSSNPSNKKACSRRQRLPVRSTVLFYLYSIRTFVRLD